MRTSINASPQWISYNIQDLSGRDLPREETIYPQHMPKIYGFAQKGRLDPQPVTSRNRNELYGSATFDELSIYATHQTPLANVLSKQGNDFMFQRILPPDAGPRSNVTLWIDVLPTTVDLYDRDAFGRYKRDAQNALIKVGTTQGYRVKWVVTHETDPMVIANTFGRRVHAAGDQNEGSVQSLRYPVLELMADSHGEHGDNLGFRMWPYGGNINDVPLPVMTKARCYPYHFNIITRKDTRSSARVHPTIFNERNITFVLKNSVSDPVTTRPMSMATVLDKNYSDNQTIGIHPIHSPFGDVVIYDQVISELLEDFHAAEIPHIGEFHDFSDEPMDKFLFNLMTGQNSNGVPYHSFQLTDDPSVSIRFSEYTNIFLAGGSDGTLSIENFNEAVALELERYTDINDSIQEMAINVESAIYDTGFPLNIKEKIIDTIMLRPDIAVFLTTMIHGEPEFGPADEFSIGVALRTRLDMLPESDYFGTTVVRGFISTNTMKLRDHAWSHRVSSNLDLAYKLARYMGSSDGRWRSDENFTHRDRKEVTIGYDIKSPYIPPNVATRRWDVGLNTLRPKGRETYIWPAYKTAYKDDTSILTSLSNMLACCQIQKVLYKVWAHFTGIDDKTPEELREAVNEDFNNEVNTKDIFAGRFIVIPRAMITAMDDLKGYEWTLPVDFGGDNMRTVMKSWIKAYRRQDLLAE